MHATRNDDGRSRHRILALLPLLALLTVPVQAEAAGAATNTTGTAALAAELAALRRLVAAWRPSINELIFRGEREPETGFGRYLVQAISPTPDPVKSPMLTA